MHLVTASPARPAYMRPDATDVDVAWSVCLSVCVFGTQMSCAKTAELIYLFVDTDTISRI